MNKVWFSLGPILISLTIGLGIMGCDDGTASNPPAPVMVCFGNSLTAGHGAAVPGVDDRTKSYPAYLQKRVTIPVINAGVSGNTTAQALERIDTDVLSKNPQIVIVELGANDLFQLIPPSETTGNLQKIIEALNDGERKIYIAKFYTEEIARSQLSSVGIPDYLQTWLIAQYDEMFSSLVSSNHTELIEDIWSGVWGIHMSDAIHPNAKGYERMADNYFKVLQAYLGANNFLK